MTFQILKWEFPRDKSLACRLHKPGNLGDLANCKTQSYLENIWDRKHFYDGMSDQKSL